MMKDEMQSKGQMNQLPFSLVMVMKATCKKNLLSNWPDMQECVCKSFKFEKFTTCMHANPEGNLFGILELIISIFNVFATFKLFYNFLEVQF